MRYDDKERDSIPLFLFSSSSASQLSPSSPSDDCDSLETGSEVPGTLLVSSFPPLSLSLSSTGDEDVGATVVSVSNSFDDTVIVDVTSTTVAAAGSTDGVIVVVDG